MPLHDVDVFHFNPVVFRKDCDNRPAFPAILAGRDDHRVSAAQRHLRAHVALVNTLLHSHYRTSGARETIFIKFFSRSSLATGPKIRVPRGLFWLVMSMTAALSSKRMVEPSGRAYGFAVR